MYTIIFMSNYKYLCNKGAFESLIVTVIVFVKNTTPAQKNIVGEITFNKKTGRDISLLVEQRSICNGKKSVIVSDNTIKAEGLGNFFKNLGKRGLNVSKKIAENDLSNPMRALVITANISTADASRNPKNIKSTLPELITFCNTGKGFYPANFV